MICRLPGFRTVGSVTLCALLILAGCTQTAPPAREAASQSAPADRSADDAARFLAGMPARPGSPFSDLESSPDWFEHRQRIQELWKPVQGWLGRMRDFHDRELHSAEITQRPAFYPFSGPDVLILTTLFPDNPTYLMVGLEPPGTLPDRRAIERAGLRRFLEGMRESVYSELHRSFFITREMDRTFRGQVTDGLTAPMLLLLALSDQRILSFRYVRIGEDGSILPRPARWQAPGKNANKGVEIVFQREGHALPQTLYYFSVNLQDSRLRSNTSFLKLLDRMGPFSTFLKATSYMPHHPDFALIRSEILSRSTAILQDDSGIPFRYFQSPAWRIQLFGSYDRPYGSFRYLEQPDLRAAYAARGATPLSFRIGYGFGKIPSNLLLAVRNDRPAAP